MKNRNELIEKDGLFWESETHEWFNDKSITDYAQQPNMHDIKLSNITAFVVRDKISGEYDRILMDNKKNAIIYDSKSLEQIGAEIDRIKIIKQFKKKI